MNWKKINNTDYEVSNYGLVRNSLTKVQNRIYKRTLGLQVIIPYDGKILQKMVHILVAESFLEDYNITKEIIHINGNKYDNKIKNLKCQKRGYRNKVPKSNKNRYQKVIKSKEKDTDFIKNILELEKKNVNKLLIN